MSAALVHCREQAASSFPKPSILGRQKGRDQGIQQQHDSGSEAADVSRPRQQQQQCTAAQAADPPGCAAIWCKGDRPASKHAQQAHAQGPNNLLAHRQQQQQQQGGEAIDRVLIPSMVQQLRFQSDNPQSDCCTAVLEHVARDLGDIAAKGPDHQAAVIAAGAVPLLLQHLGSSSSTVGQGYCALALGKTALRNPGGQDLIGQLNGIQLLAQLLQDRPNTSLTTSDKVCNRPRSKDTDVKSNPDTTHMITGLIPIGGWLQVRGCAAVALASLVWHNAPNSAAVAAAGGIESLVQLIRGSSSSSSSIDGAEVVCHAVQALGNLHKDQAAAVAAAGGVRCLVQLLIGAAATTSSSSSRCRLLHHVSKAVLNLVQHGEAAVHADLLTPDALSTLVALAGSSVDRQQLQPPPAAAAATAAAILAQLIQHSAENAAAVAVSGGLSRLVTLLHHTSSQNHSKASSIHELPAQAVTNNDKIRKNIALALAYLGQYPDYRYHDRCNIYSDLAAAAVGIGLVKPLLLLLGDGDEEVQAAAAAAFGRIIGASSSSSSSRSSSSSVLDQLVQIMLESGGVTAFVNLLRSSSSVGGRKDNSSPDGPAHVVSAGAGYVGNACSSSGSRGPARPTNDDCAGLTNSSSGGSSSILAQEWAAYTLTLLAQYSQQMQAAIFAAGALEPLTVMLHNAHLQHTAAQCIAALCLENAHIQSAVVFEGALPLLLLLLGPQCTSEAQAAAAAAIGNLVADNADLRAAAAAAGAANPVIDLLTNVRSDSKVKSWAAYALAHLGKDNADVQSAVLYSECDVLHALVEMTKSADDCSGTAQHNAPASMLSNTMHCASAAAMHNAQLHGVCALANLADNSAAIQAAVVKAGGLQALIGLLRRSSSSDTWSTTGSSSSMGSVGSSSRRLQEVAAFALWAMARHNPVISRDIAAAGALTTLVNILSSSSAAAVAAAAAAEVAADAASVVSTCDSDAPQAPASSSSGSNSSNTTKTCLADSLQQWASHASLFLSDHCNEAVGQSSAAQQRLGQAAGTSVAACADAGPQTATATAADRQRDASHVYDSGSRSHPSRVLAAQHTDRRRKHRHSISTSSSASSAAATTAISHMQKLCHLNTHDTAYSDSSLAASSSKGCCVTAAARTSSSSRVGKSSRSAIAAASPRGTVTVHPKGRRWQAAPLTAVVRPSNTSRER